MMMEGVMMMIVIVRWCNDEANDIDDDDDWYSF